MSATTSGWREITRRHAIDQFRQAWERAPAAGRDALIEAVAAGGAGHRWENGSRACVLALLVGPLLRPGESPRAGAYRMFGCQVTDDFPVTWDAHGVSAAELLASVGIAPPRRSRRWFSPRLFGRGAT